MKGSVGVWLKLASAKMAKVPTVVKMTKIHRNMRSTTMATYCQSSLSWQRRDGRKGGREREGRIRHENRESVTNRHVAEKKDDQGV